MHHILPNPPSNLISIAVLRDVLRPQRGDAQADRDLQEAGRDHQAGAALPQRRAPAAGGRGGGESQADHDDRADGPDAGELCDDTLMWHVMTSSHGIMTIYLLCLVPD